jgi:hypothetical protein
MGKAAKDMDFFCVLFHQLLASSVMLSALQSSIWKPEFLKNISLCRFQSNNLPRHLVCKNKPHY